MEKTVETKFGEITLRDAMLDMDGTNLEDGLEVKIDGEYLMEFAGMCARDFNDDDTDETDIEKLEEFIQAYFDEIMNLPDFDLQITGWNFAGRSGWLFVLECDGDDDVDLGSKDIAAIEEVVEKYCKPCETRNFYGVSIVPVEGKSDECRLDVQKVTLSERDDDAGEYASFEEYCEAAGEEMLDNITGQGSDGILLDEKEFQEFKDKINRL